MDNLWISAQAPGARRALSRAKTPKLPSRKLPFSAVFVGASGSRDPAKQRETPKLPIIKYLVSGVLFWQLGRTGRARGFPPRRMAEVCDKYFARGLDKRLVKHYITG